VAIAALGARVNPRLIMLGGSGMFLVSIFLMPLMPSFWLACLLVALGGLGVAGFSNMQTALVLSGAPASLRSRLLGLITVCIGAGPLGLLAIGALAEAIGPMAAVMVMAGCGVATLTATGIYWFRSDTSLATTRPDVRR
jgi:MFS family permease